MKQRCDRRMACCCNHPCCCQNNCASNCCNSSQGCMNCCCCNCCGCCVPTCCCCCNCNHGPTCEECKICPVSGCPEDSKNCEWYPIQWEEDPNSRKLRLCCDESGCCGLFPEECRNTFWPDFAHPRWLCCKDLYCARKANQAFCKKKES